MRDTKSAQASPVFLSNRRDVPVEHLRRVWRITEKRGKKPGFGMSPISSPLLSIRVQDEGSSKHSLTSLANSS
jgi:hypothetical protein